MKLPRVVAAETLDGLAATDPAAQRSRRDLRRVHAAMGTRGIVRRGWQALWPAPPARKALEVLELGAGDGTLLLAVARTLPAAWPPLRLTLLDRQPIVSAATLQAYAALGWAVSVEVADVADWAAADETAAARAGRARWDLITTTLFLHHFRGPTLQALLAAAAARSERFFACEPRRGALALAGSHLVGLLGANAVTREDAVLSVHAGFRGRELTQLWPAPDRDWHTHEGAAGLFSHCFSARRTEAPS